MRRDRSPGALKHRRGLRLRVGGEAGGWALRPLAPWDPGTAGGGGALGDPERGGSGVLARCGDAAGVSGAGRVPSGRGSALAAGTERTRLGNPPGRCSVRGASRVWWGLIRERSGQCYCAGDPWAALRGGGGVFNELSRREVTF